MKNQNIFWSKVNILRVGCLTLIFAIPLLPKFPLFFIPDTSVAIRAEDFLIGTLAFLWLVYFWPKRREFFKDNLNLAILFYLLVGFVSLLSGFFITKTVLPHVGFLHFLRRVEYFVPFFIASFAFKTRRQISIALAFLFLSTVGVFIYALGQLYFGLPVISTTNVEYSKGLMLPLTEGARVNSTFAGHYDLAVFLNIVIILILALVFGCYFGRNVFLKVLAFLLASASYWLLLATESRTAFVALVIAVPPVLFLLNKKAWIIPILFLVFLGVFTSPNLAKRFVLTFSQGIEFFQKKVQDKTTLLPVAFAQFGKPPLVQPNYSPPATGSVQPPVTAKTEKPAPGEPADLLERIVYRSGGIRFDVEWPRAIRAFLKNPIFGTGYSSITLATDNDYLRALGETGILGFLAFLLIFLELGRRIIIFFKRKIEGWSQTVVAGMTGVIIAMAVNALFIDVFEASKIAILFWIFIGILVATLRISLSRNG